MPSYMLSDEKTDPGNKENSGTITGLKRKQPYFRFLLINILANNDSIYVVSLLLPFTCLTSFSYIVASFSDFKNFYSSFCLLKVVLDMSFLILDMH